METIISIVLAVVCFVAGLWFLFDAFRAKQKVLSFIKESPEQDRLGPLVGLDSKAPKKQPEESENPAPAETQPASSSKLAPEAVLVVDTSPPIASTPEKTKSTSEAVTSSTPANPHLQQRRFPFGNLGVDSAGVNGR